DGRDPAPLSPETGRMLLEWLISGAPAFDPQAARARIERAASLDELMAIWRETPEIARAEIKEWLSQRKAELSATATEGASA
ncbi:MAG: hypothetical protein N2690_07330, partial [Rhodocyclaceae bacterium]|nr:hypothetical protein [Rhodocyclaceae bacterium]